jgi:hypothetical protein
MRGKAVNKIPKAVFVRDRKLMLTTGAGGRKILNYFETDNAGNRKQTTAQNAEQKSKV